MSDVWEGGGHLTVQRDLDGNTRLVEIWELEHLAWTDDDMLGDYDVVKCWVADVNDVPHHGVPHTDDSVVDSCSFDEVPEPVRESFIEQAKNIRDALVMMESNDG